MTGGRLRSQMAGTSTSASAGLEGLAARLRALREDTEPRISQAAAARHLGVSQGKISRAETGRFLLDPEQVDALARLYGAGEDERGQLVSWAEALKPGRVDSRLIFQRGTNHFQERIRRMEEAAARVRSYQPGMVIGSLQTEAYARAVFGHHSPDEAAASVASRLARYRMMLDDPNRSWTLIQTEGALSWNLGGPAVMAGQLDHLVTASQLPNVRLGLITLATPMAFAAPHGFHIYDQQAVQIGTKTATALTSDPRDLGVYDLLFQRLEGAAVFGDEARTVIARLATRYRQLAKA
ncbi:helix-turn-helix domain-containing protein [Pseudonocardia sp. K10HN5]|uniref:Helix-turn-helix domain-containing protein n=1 Tax=Pseudonocardia acidicola TaxID=2724939 RepID=A0ABX1S895_9PSEU|nr:helix-turn-helix domain-containing protein [Pseudonocardia acidicola]